ncbi:D-beta-hydroxybutyrate dehydrogenase, mitochondrial [Phlebotomus argentipes]|uniref:D-beta-hydroxybutyrate dehydrogenase, mitochondrial n=1 Tax=Phlebotomus argentipes TaxID=94469 RepID=UPI0028932E5B|nr:D-beta-hydroxybutyrate dehydrogenase, mitochondrial [Phlebotomus argentipes]
MEVKSVLAYLRGFSSVACAGASGFLGVMLRDQWLKYAGWAGVATGALIMVTRRVVKRRIFTRSHVILITGCDSGLGYNLARKCHAMNMTVIAGVLNPQSQGARNLAQLPSHELIVTHIDLLQLETIANAHRVVREILSRETDSKFLGLINNAGVMVFGEFEWQTPDIFQRQVHVNLLGTMTITHAFLSLLRKHQGRIITVTSHCGHQPLPGLAPYAASKAALVSWTDTLRTEMRKHSVDVVEFIPGSFVTGSNIAAGQKEAALCMRKAFTAEQEALYLDYFNRYNSYLECIDGMRNSLAESHPRLLREFEEALRVEKPKARYKVEPFRYFVYHWLFWLSPTGPLRDYFVEKFMKMPQFSK